MNYNEWPEQVPPEMTGDVLWGLETYRLALFVGDISWFDVCKLSADHRMLKLSDQLYSAVGSVSANLAEGHSNASKKDQTRFYEYSLGCARETRDGYFKSRHVLGHDIALHRIRFLTSIIRLLLKLVPNTRGKKISEEQAEYHPYTLEDLIANVPMPE
jgi:four helix bundle protein